ncbi:retaining alpha-glycosidase [Paludisphaera borealis]|uniref:Retaining alpha-glycosidase n=2 Tax=Paludisphaera borealis TaxID=1387353 RepID=A0A1U7CLZ1_9BACT|nr:retaining alpha-glycosidase [Paludisphaera borealis]
MQLAWIAGLFVAFPDQPRPWVDEVVYGVIIEKFFDGDTSNNHMKDRFIKDRSKYEGGFWGGDLKGVIDKLDDLAGLGVTSILLYPVMQNDDAPIAKYLPTGYRPMDYEHVDKNFGDTATLRALVDAAHARNLRVMLDMPITLPGFHHPFLADPAKKAWFGPKSEYGVPRWRAENPEVADYLIGVCERWKERSNCDGFRLDSAHLQPVSFWKRFVAELKAAPPTKPFVILPELTVNPRQIGKFITEAGFDGAYDFSVLRARDVFGKGEDVGALSFIAREAKQFYPAPRTMLAPIDNYEKAFATIAKEPKAARTLLALTYILTLDRVPLLYAGNELGVAFSEVGGAFPADRNTSPFLRKVKALIALRNHEPALRRGDFTEVVARDSVYAFLRTFGDDRILVILNGSDQPRDFAAPIGDRAWRDGLLVDLLDGRTVKASGSDEAVRVNAFGSRIVKVR